MTVLQIDGRLAMAITVSILTSNFEVSTANGNFFEDAGEEGWQVYWKGNPGVQHPVRFELVPMTNGVDGIDLICRND